jgi:hypothetical protein
VAATDEDRKEIKWQLKGRRWKRKQVLAQKGGASTAATDRLETPQPLPLAELIAGRVETVL